MLNNVSHDPTTLDATFAALADPTRRAILARLSEGSATVNELAEPFEISLPAISRHLKVLQSAGLIDRQIEGQHRRCHLKVDALDAAASWIETYRKFWSERFDALDDYLDRTHPKKDQSDE